MELVMWVEVLSRHHHDVLARHRCTGDEICIGRGYDNDVVLDDPFLSARHLRLRRDDDGGWVAEDQGSANGLYTARGKARLDRIALDGDQIIRAGHTLLRLRAADWPVAADRIAAPQRALWPMIIALAVGILGI
jgi:pSer/pThr/pTyr-binding forkhead associated (FHA) protein